MLDDCGAIVDAGRACRHCEPLVVDQARATRLRCAWGLRNVPAGRGRYRFRPRERTMTADVVQEDKRWIGELIFLMR